MSEQKEALVRLALGEADTAEVREHAWERAVEACLEKLGHSRDEIVCTPKAAAWKVAVATHLRRQATVRNPWLATALHMGDPDAVGR